MRVRPVLVLVLAGAASLAGCQSAGRHETAAESTASARPNSSATGADTAAPTLPSSRAASQRPSQQLPPAAAAGGVCKSINFATVAQLTGVQFEVAGASGTSGKSQSCVLRRLGGSVPDLSFTVLPASSSVTPAIYQSDYVPSGAQSLSGIGRAAYSRVTTSSAGAGPKVEVGWLGRQNIYTLALTTALSTTATAAKQLVPKLASLGDKIA